MAFFAMTCTAADTSAIQSLTAGLTSPLTFKRLVEKLNLIWNQENRERTGLCFVQGKVFTGPCYECKGPHGFQDCPVWQANPNRVDHYEERKKRDRLKGIQDRQRAAAGQTGTSMVILPHSTAAPAITVVLCGICRQPHPTDDCPFSDQLCRRCGSLGCQGCCPKCAALSCPGC